VITKTHLMKGKICRTVHDMRIIQVLIERGKSKGFR